MSRRKDKERALAGHPHRGEPAKPLYRCPFPGCNRAFTREAGKSACCPYHRLFISDWIFCQANIKPETKLESGLVVPKPGMGDVAIKEVLDKVRRGERGE